MDNQELHRTVLIVAIISAVLLCHQGQTSLAQSSGGVGSSFGASAQANAELNSSIASGNAQSSISLSSSSGSTSDGASSGANLGGDSGGNGGGSRGSSLGSGSTTSSSSASSQSSATNGNASASASASSQATPAWLSSTPKPEGIFGRIKDAVKSSVENLTQNSPSKKEEAKQPSSGSSAGPGASLGSGDNQGQSSGGTGIMDKIGDAAKKAKDMVKDGAKEVKDDVKTMLGTSGSGGSKSEEGKSGGGLNVGGSVKIGESSLGGSMQLGGGKSESSGKSEGKSENPLNKLVHKVENKATELGNKLTGNDNKSGSGDSKSGNGSNGQAKSSSGGASGSSGDKNSGDKKSVAVDMFDKFHEASKGPVEAAMKPIDKALGFEKDPIIKIYDESHEMIRKPLSMVAKPVESMLSGAFKTSDEAKAQQERLMSEQERREMKLREERARKEGRSVLGQIADKTVELIEKPYEIILKPVDHMLGFDKDGKKDPLIKLFDEIYNMSKKPIDVLAKPLENILKKMAEGEQAYQVSLRINSDAGADPKLLTRLADGALNIADRVITKPIDLAMRPLGYDGQKKKNPIVESTHQLKNATKLGFELFTRPIDRIIKEISDIGASRSETEEEADRERRRQEASRIVRMLDRLHEAAQTPWEIVLRPVGRALGYSREGKKEPLLRAWDVLHQVVRTPIQVVSKPVEDAILGEQKRQQRTHARAEVRVGSKSGGQSQTQIGGGPESGGKREDPKKNIFTDGIKRWEKFAAKPFDKITSPIRKLILGEDDKVGKGTKAKAQVNGPGGAQAQARIHSDGADGEGPDKIVKTLEKMNNVVLKPLEVVTQPISDIISPDNKGKKGGDVKVQAQMKVGSSAQSGAREESNQSRLSASAGAQVRGGISDNGQNKISASASAQLKRN